MNPGEFSNLLVLLLVQAGILVGLVGLFIPVFPGLLVVWGSILVYGLINGFGWIGGILFFIISLIGLAASLADNVFMAGGARSGGASWSSILVAMVAAIIGTIVMPPFGGFLFAPLAVLLLEYLRRRNWRQAREAVVGMAKGYGLAFFLRLMGGFLMMILWWMWVVLTR
jgi:uncharacterized protein